MRSRIERWLEGFGQLILDNGWADPWTTVPPLGRADPEPHAELDEHQEPTLVA